jgi:hypothetical protein
MTILEALAAPKFRASAAIRTEFLDQQKLYMKNNDNTKVL